MEIFHGTATECHLQYGIIPATRHKWTHPALAPAMQAGTRFTYPGEMEGWVDLVDLIAPRELNQRPFDHASNAQPMQPPRQPVCLSVCLWRSRMFSHWLEYLEHTVISRLISLRFLFGLTPTWAIWSNRLYVCLWRLGMFLHRWE